jgi:RND family efflux transporter MFP subunit
MPSWVTWRRALGALLTIIVVAAIAGGIALRVAKKAAAEAPGGSAGPPVTLECTPADVARIESRELARWLPVSGTLQPVNQTTVKAKVSGDIRQVFGREGEAVKAGQVLARLDTADLEAKLTDRIGALEASRAQLALAEKTRTQNRTLLTQGFISQNAYDSAESNLSVTQGTLKSYEAQVQLARNALRDAVVNAPISGTLAKRHVQPGEKVNFDSPLFTIVDLGKMELQAMVPANDIPEIKLEMAVELSIDGFGERSFAGSVERINPMTEAGTRAILVFVQIPNPDAALRAAVYRRIRLPAVVLRRPLRRSDRGGADSRVDHRRRQADPAQRAARPPRRGSGAGGNQVRAVPRSASTGCALRQSQGRRSRGPAGLTVRQVRRHRLDRLTCNDVDHSRIDQ